MSQVGSSALASHIASTWQLAEQLACASTEARQTGGWKSTASVALSEPLAPNLP
jgi:hypothetical protein